MKNEKRNSIMRRMILFIAVLIFFYSGYQIISTFLEYEKGEKEYQELEQLILNQQPVSTEAKETEKSNNTVQIGDSSTESSIDIQTQEEIEETTSSNVQSIDFETLLSINSDAKGWITVGGTNINYPIVQASDNDYYLRRTIYGTKNNAGSIFIDGNIAEGMEAKNVIIYGHNMKDGSMFGTLSYYRKESMFQANPTFDVYTESAAYQYQIFAAFVTKAGSDTYTYQFSTEESFLNYIERVKASSLYDTGVEVSKEDKIITLSTCSGKGDDRFVVLAKRMIK